MDDGPPFTRHMILIFQIIFIKILVAVGLEKTIEGQPLNISAVPLV